MAEAPDPAQHPGAPASPESKRWFKRLRDNVKGRIFRPGDTERSLEAPPGDEPIDAETPARIGRYVVIRRIGVGGMSLVYAAYDETLDRKIAVKLLRPGSANAGSEGQARLMREAQSLARLSHPAVIQVYEVGTVGDQVYLSMEFIDGVTLKRWQADDARSPREILAAYLAAGEGLAAAHAAGIVHRDFKADNVLVRRDGAVRVLDFGLARTLLGAEAPPTDTAKFEASAAVVPLTRTGAIMGTPAYMAPEQHQGKPVDPRTDQFSFCVSLYEALYGYRPFSGDTLGHLRENVLDGNIEDAPKYVNVPPRLRKALVRGLSVDPSNRFPSMEALLEELSRDARALLAWTTAVVIALLALGGLAYGWWSAQGERAAQRQGDQLRAEFERARVVHAQEEVRRARARSVSQKWDDLVLAYARETVERDPTRALAALKHLSPQNEGWLPAARTLAADAELRGPVYREFRDTGLSSISVLRFTPDGKRLVALGAGIGPEVPRGIAYELSTGVATLLLGAGTTLHDLAVNNTTAAAAGEDGQAHVWSLAGTDYRALPLSERPLRAIAIAPDNAAIAVGGDGTRVMVATPDGEVLHALRDHEAPIRALVFSADGEHVVSGGDDGTLRMWFLKSGKNWKLDPRGSVSHVRLSTNTGAVASLADDGQLRFWWMDSGRLRRGPWPTEVVDFDLDASGDFVVASHRDGSVRVYEQGDPNAVRLHRREGELSNVAISPNARLVAGAVDGVVQLWRVGLDASGRPHGSARSVRTSEARSIRALSYAPDGSALATGGSRGSVRLLRERGDWVDLGRMGDTVQYLRFSPDGLRLAVADVSGGVSMAPVPALDTIPSQLAVVAERVRGEPIWSSQSDQVATAQCPLAEQCSITVYGLDGTPTVVLPSVGSVPERLRFSPDARHMLSTHGARGWLWDLATGDGREIDWGDAPHPGELLAVVFPAGTEGARLATRRTDGASTLRVWHLDIRTGDVHLLLEQPALETLVADDGGRALLLAPSDERPLLWSLDDDRFRVLPEGIGDADRFQVGSDGDAILLRYGKTGARMIDVPSGQTWELPPLGDVVAWSPRGIVADAQIRRIRQFDNPSPTDVDAFVRWLDETTRVAIDASEIR